MSRKSKAWGRDGIGVTARHGIAVLLDIKKALGSVVYCGCLDEWHGDALYDTLSVQLAFGDVDVVMSIWH